MTRADMIKMIIAFPVGCITQCAQRGETTYVYTCIEEVNEDTEPWLPYKGIFISRTLYHGSAINAELSSNTT